MSLAYDGLNCNVKSHTASIRVEDSHPLIRLANIIPWDKLVEIVLDDLKTSTKKGCWNVGRKLFLRTHLAIYILQARLKRTDEEIIFDVENHGIYRAFCGATLIKNWKCPHANKIQEFRSRLKPETQSKINDCIVLLAFQEGYANPEEMDIDSTVQEANITYPADARLMRQLAEKCKRLVSKFKLKIPFDFKKVMRLSKEYFYMPKNKPVQYKREIFKKYYLAVRAATLPIIKWAEDRIKETTSRLKWNTKIPLKQVAEMGRKYLRDVGYFVKNHKLKKGKILSFCAKAVKCIKKGKVGKEYEFGRVFQLARIGGNFLFALYTTDIRLDDKTAVKLFLEKHQALFGKSELNSLGADRGYYETNNIKIAQDAEVKNIGIQEPAKLKNRVNATSENKMEKLACRRAGIEPLIGHAKRFGLGKSKMKSDESTHASGFQALLGFNIRQLERKIKDKFLKKCA